MKKGARQSTNVIDLRGPKRNVFTDPAEKAIVEAGQKRADMYNVELNKKLLSHDTIAKHKNDPIDSIIEQSRFAGNNDPRGRISDLGVSPQRGFSGTNKPQKFKKPSKGK